MKVAIMQPTYLPWLGYLSMIRQVDAFVFLDNVQFSPRSWQQRNRIRTPSGEEWLTVPTSRPLGRSTKISEAQVNYDHSFPDGHVRALASNYGECLFASSVLNGVESILQDRVAGLRDLNVRLIEYLCSILKISTPLILASELQASGKQADLLLSISRELGADQYLSAPASSAYLDDFLGFRQAGIDVEYFEYSHPEYRQRYEPFISHLSAVDAIATQGPEWVVACI